MLKVSSFITGSLQVCTYLVYCKDTKEALLIDPGEADEGIVEKIKNLGLNLKVIFGTHGHPDHLLGVNYFRERLRVPFILHQADERFFREPENFMTFKLWGFPENPRADGVFQDGFVLTLGNQKLLVIHTPGHSPGSCCLYSKEAKLVFTGDTLFVQGIGRADLPGGSFSQMLNSIREKLLTLPEDTIIYPGHDYGPKPYSTIREERELNPYLQEFSL